MRDYKTAILGIGLVPPEEDGLRLITRDPRRQRVQTTLAEISQPDYHDGMISWLGEAHPDLYDELTSRLLDEIDLAWRSRVLMAEFDALLARLVKAHRQACGLYRAARPARSKNLLHVGRRSD